MDHKGIKNFPTHGTGYAPRQDKEVQESDFWAMALFLTAIAGLIAACCYVVSRLSRERAYREKWNDYDDCGWA